MSSFPPAILLMGPTASGKTAIAIELARQFPVELISVDSAQVFCDMDIGTAKPDAETLAACPHHLINLISPEEAYSAARFRADALSLIAGITARGRVPLLVGGTMLYFKALQEGLAELPQACPDTRASIDAEAAEHGWPHVHAELEKVDPQTAARLSPNDAQRVQRALEIYRLSGRPMSALLAEGDAQQAPCSFLSLGLSPTERSVLHHRIEQRFDGMLAAGLEEEVTRLRQQYRLTLNLPSMRCVGYRQVWEAQDGLAPRREMRDRGIYATRQLAKRQLTWMNNTLKPECFDSLDPKLGDRILQRVDEFLSDSSSSLTRSSD